jgi:type IV pilus assembly protein PilC
MARYRYSAQNQAGELYERTVETPDRFGVYAQIRKEGGSVIEVKEEHSEQAFARLWASFQGMLGSVKESEKIVFARNLSTMLKAGLPLSRALEALKRQANNKKFTSILDALNADVTKGIAFHEALEKFPGTFSRLFISMVKAGEESGRIVESLQVVAKQMERAYNLKKKIRGALIYPSIVVLAMVGIGILMLIYVVPTLTQTFEELGVELPRSTQIIITVSKFMSENTIGFLALLSLFVLSVIGAFRTSRGKRVFEYGILHIPIISGIVREVNSARTARTLSSLLASGVDIVRALSITRDVVQNSYFKDVLAEAEADIQKGEPLSSTFARHERLYPVMMSEMVAVGGETGKLKDLLQQIAEFYEDEVEQKTKDLSTVIEPFLMLIIGSVVGFFAVSMISPIYSISSGI